MPLPSPTSPATAKAGPSGWTISPAGECAEDDSTQPKTDSTPPQLIGRSRTTAHIWGAQGTWPLQLHIEFVPVPEAGRPVWKMQRAVASTY